MQHNFLYFGSHFYHRFVCSATNLSVIGIFYTVIHGYINLCIGRLLNCVRNEIEMARALINASNEIQKERQNTIVIKPFDYVIVKIKISLCGLFEHNKTIELEKNGTVIHRTISFREN